MTTPNTQTGSKATSKKKYATASDYETRPMAGAENGFQERIMKQINDLGEILERAGDTVSGKGWETIGKAIHRLGDTLEHLRVAEKKSGTKHFGSDSEGEDSEVEMDDEVLGKSANFSAALKDTDTKGYTGASRAEPFDKSEKPKASDSQAY